VVAICVIGVINKSIKIDKYLNNIEIYNMSTTPPRKTASKGDPARINKYITMDDGNGKPQEYYWYHNSEEEQRLAAEALELQLQETAMLKDKKKSDDVQEKVGLKTKKCCVVQNHNKIKLEW